jgi:hypothetical protein
MSTTDEFWELNGTSLHLPGWNIQTLGGSRFGVPSLRGDDIQYAYVPGDEFREKEPASRTLTLAMWTIGADPQTGSLSGDQRRQWNDNWRTLRRLMWNPKQQFTLTRRWLLSDGEGDPYIQIADARGQYTSGLEPTMTGRTRATFTIDIKLADPFFYGAQETYTINKGATLAITNQGDYLAAHRHVTVDFVGPLVNPKLTNTTPTPDVFVKYTGSIGTGYTVSLDITEFSATTDEPIYTISDVAANRVGKISHGGARRWIGLLAGTNSLTLTADSGTGHAVVRYRPPYI